MRKRNLLPSVAMLFFSAFAIFTFHIATKLPKNDYTPDWKEVPVYTYLSPYATLSPYDHHFREAADSIGYDWTLIAAIAFTESRFDSTAVSEAGAQGVMQVMPETMRGFGIPDSLHCDNRSNIMTAARLLQSLEKQFRPIKDPEERIKFILASYNAGFGYIHDAMRLARKYGYDRYKWEANVDSFLIHLSKPEYYTDTLCRNGQFNGWQETLSFVKKVHRHWHRFQSIQQNYSDSIREVILTDSTKRIMQ
jgi:membrane-bound lytic murein transglycosylase F